MNTNQLYSKRADLLEMQYALEEEMEEGSASSSESY